MLCEFVTEDENTHHLKKKNKNSVFKIKQGRSQNSCDKNSFQLLRELPADKTEIWGRSTTVSKLIVFKRMRSIAKEV